MSEPAADDAHRWVDARSVVGGLPTVGARQRNADSVLVQTGLIGAALVVGTVLAASLHAHLEIRLATTSTARALGWVLLCSGPVIAFAGGSWSRRRRRSQPPRSPLSPMASLNRRQRRELRRAIHRDEAVPVDRREVAAYQAGVLAHPWPGLITAVGTLMVPWGDALLDDGVVPVWVSALTVLMLGWVGWSVWDGWRARVWLAAHEGGRLHRVH